jgi:hypothetical protein
VLKVFEGNLGWNSFYDDKHSVNDSLMK